MGRVKSAICMTVITLAIAVLCLVCFVPFPVGSGGIRYFNPIVNWTDKSAELGGYQFGGTDSNYLGGSFNVVFYPEGVVSAKEHSENLAMLEGDDLEDYEEKYVSCSDGRLWLEKETVCDGGTAPTEEFEASFQKRVEVLKERFERLHAEGAEFAVSDQYTVRVSLPASLDASIASFVYFAYMGKLEVSFGSSLDSATRVFPLEGSKEKPVETYIKSAGTRTINGVVYLGLHFTKEGADLIKSATADAETTPGTLFFTVGGDQIIGLSVSNQLVDKDLYISGDYTTDAANILSTVVDTAIKYDGEELGKMELGQLYQDYASFGNSALPLVYAAIGVLFVCALILIAIRYGGLAVAHLYSFLFYAIVLLICVWAIPSLSIGMPTLLAFAITAALLTVSNVAAFEGARREYALGKTMASSVRTGYKKCFWPIFDSHIVLIGMGILIWPIAVAELSSFGLCLALGAFIGGVATMLLNRFMWYILTPLTKNAGKFCRFKREEVEDD